MNTNKFNIVYDEFRRIAEKIRVKHGVELGSIETKHGLNNRLYISTSGTNIKDEIVHITFDSGNNTECGAFGITVSNEFNDIDLLDIYITLRIDMMENEMVERIRDVYQIFNNITSYEY